ncbi:MAG: DUF3291 domain-containing protein [Rhodospirillales bacterium]|nr:DUF3291 domain-containing protein [Rhodospirillales bacterium]
MTEYHLAQLNIAKAVDQIDSDTLAPFVALLDDINALAEASPGFVWRLKDDTGNATAIGGFEDPRMIVNMSVWQGVEPLMDFVYRTAHTPVMARRREWFEVMSSAYQVLWWIEAGALPTIAEARERLAQLQEQGPSERAFTFKARYPRPLAV